MKNKRISQRVLSITLAVIMMVSTMMVGAYAAGENNLTVGTISGTVGSTVSVPVSISLADNASGIGFSISYDSNLTLTGTTLNTSLVSAEQFQQNLTYGANGAKFLIDWSNDIKQPSGVLFYLNFTIKGSAGNNDLLINFSSSADSMITDSSLNYLTATTTSGAVNSRYNYTVDFNSKGGSNTDAQSVVYGGKVTKPADPTRTGYTFGGWFSDEAISTAWDFANGTVSNNITLYAKWTRVYTVSGIWTYLPNNDGPTATITACSQISGDITIPSTIDGFTVTSISGHYYQGEKSMFDDNAKNITSILLPSTLTSIGDYVLMGCSGLTSIIIPNGVTSIGDNAYYGSHVFQGCSALKSIYFLGDAPAINGTAFDNPNDLKFYYLNGKTGWTTPTFTSGGVSYNTAVWSCDVTFISNGGSAVAAQLVAYGDKATKPTDPTRTGYIFSGWYSDSGLTSTWNFTTNAIGAANITLYAKWTAKQYFINFELNGGSLPPNQGLAAWMVYYGQKLTKPTFELTRTGYTLTDWCTDAGLTTPWDFNNDTVGAANFTFYAKWTANQYAVSFESNGGSAVTSQTIDLGGKVTMPTAPTKTGYVFLGWYSDIGLASSWAFGINTVDAAKTLYAKWALLGDINQNGVIDLQDFILQQNAYLGKATLSATQLLIGDMDCDGITNELSDCMASAQAYLIS